MFCATLNLNSDAKYGFICTIAKGSWYLVHSIKPAIQWNSKSSLLKYLDTLNPAIALQGSMQIGKGASYFSAMTKFLLHPHLPYQFFNWLMKDAVIFKANFHCGRFLSKQRIQFWNRRNLHYDWLARDTWQWLSPLSCWPLRKRLCVSLRISQKNGKFDFIIYYTDSPIPSSNQEFVM